MTMHYHGTDVPVRVLYELTGRCLCVSYLGTRKREVEIAHRIAQSIMLDNGAFSVWRAGKAADWAGFYRWVEPWLDHHTTWAVIPDVIDGDEAANDNLLAQWPHGTRGAPVWHMHEPVARLLRLAERWPRICIGSSGQYAIVGDACWHARMVVAMNELCGNGPPPVWLHMLRGMALGGSIYPFASVDSSDIARNHNRPQNSPRAMADRWDAMQCPGRWAVQPVQLELVA
jgi:hypothetical protein